MKPKKRSLRNFLKGLAILTLIPLTSCAVMNARYQKWNDAVTRDPEGVLSYARPREYGEGKTALLLVHGFGDGPQVWEKLGPRLAEKGYRVKAMRLPGWCEPVEAKRKVELADWENAIEQELADLRKRHDKTAVIAHSLGGCLAAVLAQNRKLDTDALILYAPMFEISSARSPLLKTRTWFEMGSKILPDAMIIESLFGDHARVHPPRPRTRRDPFNPKHIFYLLYAEMDRFEGQTPEIQIPLRLLLPGEDRVVRSERSRIWFENLDAPEKVLVTMEKAGHVLPLDMDVLAESDRITVWLSEQGIAP